MSHEVELVIVNLLLEKNASIANSGDICGTIIVDGLFSFAAMMGLKCFTVSFLLKSVFTVASSYSMFIENKSYPICESKLLL